MSRIIHNIKLLVIALVLSFCLAYIIKHPDFFVSSILNIQEIKEIEEKQRDIAYKTDNQLLDIFLPMTGKQMGLLSLMIAHGPDITLDIDQLTGQVIYSNIQIQSGYLLLEFNDITTLSPTESLISIPFSGDSNHILIEQATITYNNQAYPLAIGKLSIASVHGGQ